METITLNGKEYVAKEGLKNHEKSYEHFSLEKEKKLHVALQKIKGEEKDFISEEEVMAKEPVVVIDPANVCMIIAKTTNARTILRRYITAEVDEKEQKIPDLNYKPDKEDEIIARFSVEYMKRIINFFAVLNDGGIQFKMKKDFPFTIEDEHFRVILAPRVDNN